MKKKEIQECIDEAIVAFEEHGIESILRNPRNAHFHCFRKRDLALFEYYASTGTITGQKVKGLRALLNILTEGGKF